MKSMLRVLLVAATVLLSTNLYADNKSCDEVREQRKAEKIAYITSELELTSEEAVVFWPIYNEWWSEMRKTHKLQRETFKKIEELLAQEDCSPAELEQTVRSYCDVEELRGSLMKKYFNRFSEVISMRKIAGLYRAEEEYRMNYIKQLKQRD